MYARFPLPRGSLRYALCGAILLLALPSHGAPALPDWDLSADHMIEFPTALQSIDGAYDADFAGLTGVLNVSYRDDGVIVASGGLTGDTGLNFVGFVGRASVDESGEQVIELLDRFKKPDFHFTGRLVNDDRDIVGSFEAKAGFAGAPTDTSGPMELLRRGNETGKTGFMLDLPILQAFKGKLSSPINLAGDERRAMLTLFGGQALTGGRVKGKLKTRAKDGTTKAKVKVKGKGWSIKLAGPVDEDGFHAVAQLKTPLYRLKDVPLTLDVIEGPDDPPPPPPPDPKNLLKNARARIELGQVEITHSKLSKKFFGKTARLTVRFPFAAAVAGPVTADPTTFPGPEPAQVIVALGKNVYTTQLADSEATLTAQVLNTAPGRAIEILLTGELFNQKGKRKPLDILVRATLE
jgi:hypothetical protein